MAFAKQKGKRRKKFGDHMLNHEDNELFYQIHHKNYELYYKIIHENHELSTRTTNHSTNHSTIHSTPRIKIISLNLKFLVSQKNSIFMLTRFLNLQEHPSMTRWKPPSVVTTHLLQFLPAMFRVFDDDKNIARHEIYRNILA